MLMTEDLIARARAGEDAAFRKLTEPHRRELQMHCYRMLGSLQDAEDALQETLLAAWQGLGGYQQRASLRTWLFRIATNRCLNQIRSTRRRPAKEWHVPNAAPPEPTRLGEVVWLEPYPDSLIDEEADDTPGPEARYAQTQSISLAFVAALQLLPPRQLAVLILRDVLDFEASEVAEMLETTLDSVNSALKRARANLQQHWSPKQASANESALVSRFVAAYEASDLDTLVAMFTDDVFMSMPPMPFEYIGPEAVGRFCGLLFGSGRHFELVRTRANGQPAFGMYVRLPAGPRPGIGLMTLTLSEDGICSLSRFEPGMLPWFGLPSSLPPLKAAGE